MYVTLPFKFKIDVASQYFRIYDIDRSVLPTLMGFLYLWKKPVYKRGSVYGQNKQKEKDTFFGVYSQINEEFRFHNGQINEFIRYLMRVGIDDSEYAVRYLETTPAAPAKFKIKPNWVLKPYQNDAKDFTLKPIVPIEAETNCRLIAFPMGYGKTVTSLITMATREKRLAITILPRYIKKWIKDVNDVFNLKKKDLLVIKSTEDLRNVLLMAKNDEIEASIIIFSSVTLRDFIKLYETEYDAMEDNGYEGSPDNLFEALGIGSLIIDEMHQHFHAMFKILLYTNIELFLALTATLVSKDYFISNLYKLVFPRQTRFEEVKMKKFIDLYAYGYSVHDFVNSGIRSTERGSNDYSQNAFEKSIMSNQNLLKQYLELIYMIFEIKYLNLKQTGERVIIFAGMVEMCDNIIRLLKKRHPDLHIVRYTAGDSYDEILKADVTVTTVIKAGAAVDIPGLITNIGTPCIDSLGTNLQFFGRLREIPNRPTTCVYIYCKQIPKQVQYHHGRMRAFRDISKTINDIDSGVVLRR